MHLSHRACIYREPNDSSDLIPLIEERRERVTPFLYVDVYIFVDSGNGM
jgi:hypothetical protein